MRIESTKDKVELAKRTHLPIKLSEECPQCGQNVEQALTEHYLSYPVVNEPFKYGFYCEDCGHEWDKDLVLRVVLEEAEA